MIPEKPSDYFAYKKSKIQNNALREEKKPISKFSFLCQLFIATFVIIFIVIVFIFMKYSQKMGVEYFKGDLSHNEGEEVSSYEQENEEQQKIDKRLTLIQQEENAPSVRVVLDDKANQEVMDSSIIEQSQKEQKLEERKLAKETKTTVHESQKEKTTTLKSILDDLKPPKTQNETAATTSANSNITIMSKVLIGKYSTLEEAQENAKIVKARHPNLAPYAKKVGEVYSVQMGSYQDFNIAKTQAQNLKASGYDVWIYQQ